MKIKSQNLNCLNPIYHYPEKKIWSII